MERTGQELLDWLEDNYAEWRKIYSESVVASRRDLREEEARIKAEIKKAREALG
jgi:hypothetical protein